MDEYSVAFITCVNNEKMYQKSLDFIKRLDVPNGINIECIAVYDAVSLTNGYNVACSFTTAKYKVYLHQDVYILHKYFIRDILKLCKTYKKVGMVGVIGARTLPQDGTWWKTYNGTGKVYDSHKGYMGSINYKRQNKPFDTVVTIDGLIMMTQYDIPWREDLFDGWHFYDASQCFEYRLAGYEVIVPYQEMPWCAHDCGIVSMKGYDYYRKIFIEHYMG